ncbi:hypothetical protein M2272_005874 [Mycobacterium frederiksbergense]|uniref:Uncharacterized protein n=1 Tax=Mycolicibacterium frederiksbergense TaxID=117567 RepID=A0ABT6L8C9_9MYCO|nr:hypothetical protein [Mycolicibacterium frederiksbergense]MDH6199206.1 hypothetical protein [Mycolicibacterium frederiksbergense]
MKTITIDQINWPVAEPGDFDTRTGAQVFTVMEDEDGERYYAYGHVPEEQMLAEVTRYLNHMIPSGDFDDIADGTGVGHVYAKFIDHDAERFEWCPAETPGAFPMSVVSF